MWPWVIENIYCSYVPLSTGIVGYKDRTWVKWSFLRWRPGIEEQRRRCGHHVERWRKEEKRRLDKGQKKRGRGNKQEKRRANMRGEKPARNQEKKWGSCGREKKGRRAARCQNSSVVSRVLREHSYYFMLAKVQASLKSFWKWRNHFLYWWYSNSSYALCFSPLPSYLRTLGPPPSCRGSRPGRAQPGVLEHLCKSRLCDSHFVVSFSLIKYEQITQSVYFGGRKANNGTYPHMVSHRVLGQVGQHVNVKFMKWTWVPSSFFPSPGDWSFFFFFPQ